MGTVSTTARRLRPHSNLTRSIAVFLDGQIVGGAYSHLLEMSVPGGAATVAGVSKVEAQPTQTRRGIMTQMIRHQIDGIHERRNPWPRCSPPRAPSPGGSTTVPVRLQGSSGSNLINYRNARDFAQRKQQ